MGAGIAVDEWLTEIGSGLEFQRPVFRALMEQENRELGLLLVAHQDRLCRFGFDWFAYFAERHGCEIRVVNQVPVAAGGVGRGPGGRRRHLLLSPAQLAPVPEAAPGCRHR